MMWPDSTASTNVFRALHLWPIHILMPSVNKPPPLHSQTGHVRDFWGLYVGSCERGLSGDLAPPHNTDTISNPIFEDQITTYATYCKSFSTRETTSYICYRWKLYVSIHQHKVQVICVTLGEKIEYCRGGETVLRISVFYQRVCVCVCVW